MGFQETTTLRSLSTSARLRRVLARSEIFNETLGYETMMIECQGGDRGEGSSMYLELELKVDC
jgi:hypothetical protein